MEKANKDLIYEDVNMKMPEFPIVTKEDFMSQYEKYKDSPELALNLYIHMPDDSTEIIFNSQGHNKVEYVNKTYDEKMTHKNSKDIYIVGFDFFPDKILEYGFDMALKLFSLVSALLVGDGMARTCLYITFLKVSTRLRQK